MTSTDIIALIITIIGVASFAAVVTILFRNYIRSSIKEVSLGNRDIEIVDLMLYETDERVKRRRKTTEIVKNVLYYTFLAVVIPLFGLSLYSKIKNNVTKIGDQYVMVVASGSMSFKNSENKYLVNYNLDNQFNTYDMITLTSVKGSYQLKQYDVIAFRNDRGINVIHRIISVDYEEGEVRYTTRGDANSGNDSYKPTYEDVIGKYTGKRIQGIGIFIMFFQSYAGIVTVLSVVYCSLMIGHFNKKLEEANDNRRSILEQAFDVQNMNVDDAEIMSPTHANTIYYKGYVYEFDDKGYKGKREMTQEEKDSVEETIKVEEQDKEKNKKNDDESDKKQD